MKINLKSYLEKLDINKLEKLNFSLIKNYGLQYQIHYPPGAMQMHTITAHKGLFVDMLEFFTHILALRYARYISFEMPEKFLEEDIEVDEFDVIKFNKYLNGYVESYLESTENSIWKITLNVDNYIRGYNVITKGTGLFLVCETTTIYLAYFYTSID